MGGALNSSKPFECCGGEDIGLPRTYRYTPPKGGPLPCSNYSWWGMLRNASRPLWQIMKAAAEASSRADDAAMLAEGWLLNSSQLAARESIRVWAGSDAELAGADVHKARRYVGSAWGRSGQRQAEAARRFLDLRPGHDFLEVGCGALNAGQFFLQFLADARYVCVEPNTVLHEESIAASPELKASIESKQPLLIARDDFDPRPGLKAERRFDRSWSHSVLSHAADWQLMQYFEVMKAVLNPSTGVGMASIRFSDAGGQAEWPSHDAHWIYPGVSYFDFGEAKCMAERAGLELTLVPEARLFMIEVVPAEHHDWIRMQHLRQSPGT